MVTPLWPRPPALQLPRAATVHHQHHRPRAAAPRGAAPFFAFKGRCATCFYFAVGANDVYAIAQLPDIATAAAVDFAAAASGAATSNVVAFLTPERTAEAAAKPVFYHAARGKARPV